MYCRLFSHPLYVNISYQFSFDSKLLYVLFTHSLIYHVCKDLKLVYMTNVVICAADDFPPVICKYLLPILVLIKMHQFFSL